MPKITKTPICLYFSLFPFTILQLSSAHLSFKAALDHMIDQPVGTAVNYFLIVGALATALILLRYVFLALILFWSVSCIVSLGNYYKIKETTLSLTFRDLFSIHSPEILLKYIDATALVTVGSLALLFYIPFMIDRQFSFKGLLVTRLPTSECWLTSRIFFIFLLFATFPALDPENTPLYIYRAFGAAGSRCIWVPGSCGTLLGLPLNFITEVYQPTLKRPENKALKNSFELIDDSNQSIVSNTSESPKTVIVLMFESLMDPLKLNIRLNRDPIPNFRKLCPNGNCQNLTSPAFGGFTANVEFEFLTGLPMSAIPSGIVPYSHLLQKNLFSIAKSLKESGYTTTAFHNYWGSGWYRSVVYPRLGFDKMSFLEDMEKGAWTTAYPRDRVVFQAIKRTLLSSKAQKKFIFGVTVSAHGPYDDLDYSSKKEILVLDQRLEGTKERNEAKANYEVYLNRLYQSDLDFGEFMNSLDMTNTAILTFGDHQPSVVSKLLALDTLQSLHWNRYVVPVGWLDRGTPKILGTEAERNEMYCVGGKFIRALGVPLLVQFKAFASICGDSSTQHSNFGVEGNEVKNFVYDVITNSEALIDFSLSLQGANDSAQKAGISMH